MELISVKFNKKHKQFEKGTTVYFSKGNEQNGLRFSFLCGKNGSGKTTVMSIVAQIFHNIEWNHHVIPAEVELIYSICYNGKIRHVTLKTKNPRLSMSVEGEFENKYLIDNKAFSKAKYRQFIKREISRGKIVTHEIVNRYLPKSIVASVFSMHNEWPTSRPHNFTGLELVSIHEISGIYGKNHYGLPSITRGVCRFLSSYYEGNNVLSKLLKDLGWEFTGKIKINVPYQNNKIWVHTNKKNYKNIVSSGYSEEIYINDVEFNRNGRSVFLDNMSSGEKMLIHRIFSILSYIENDSLVFIEEPELHLDPQWKKQLITILSTAFSNYVTHFIISTHSPSLINTVSKENIVYLELGKQKDITLNTFLLDEEELTGYLFTNEMPFNNIEQDVLKKISEASSPDTLNEILDNLGNSVFRLIAKNKLKLLNEKA